VKGGQHLAKDRGIKGDHVGEHIENLMRTHWELKGNTFRKIEKKS